jgi:hypothetical protein
MNMGQRVDKVTIMIERSVEFGGMHGEGNIPVIFTYTPNDPYDDPFVHSLFALIEKKNRELVLAAGPPNPMSFG